MPHSQNPRTALETIPDHLRPFIAKQDPSLYTPIDHAAWRFILRVSTSFFAKNAHSKYLRGLEETGISVERIPLVDEMDAKLQRFGWRAVPVSGFIPPAVFMEFQSLGILPIACEMRSLEHLAYTPAPDIVHEAAGHAPIIADPEYSDYLREYGEVARKAIYSSQDVALFEAIRELSDIKEDSRSSQAQIDAAQKKLDFTVSQTTYISEATLLARMNWWTVEYGLVGSVAEPRIYGAGLLSSVGESFACLSPEIRKIPFTLDCVNTVYDITRPQPQLFVTPDFSTLTAVLHEFADGMAFRRGGIDGLAKAKMAESVTTTELDSGIQISGILDGFQTDLNGEIAFLKYRGPCQLSLRDQELKDQGPAFHQEGFSTPVGKLKSKAHSAAALNERELALMGFAPAKKGKLVWQSGIELEAEWIGSVADPQITTRTLIHRFKDCTIRWVHDGKTEILYRPEWGTFDLAAGMLVGSVFGGAADRARFAAETGAYAYKTQIPKTNLTDANRALNELSAQIRKVREAGVASSAKLTEIASELEAKHPQDWLSRLELLELAEKWNLTAPWLQPVRTQLEALKKSSPVIATLVGRGLEILAS